MFNLSRSHLDKHGYMVLIRRICQWSSVTVKSVNTVVTTREVFDDQASCLRELSNTCSIVYNTCEHAAEDKVSDAQRQGV